jgi:hypothetical protein
LFAEKRKKTLVKFKNGIKKGIPENNLFAGCLQNGLNRLIKNMNDAIEGGALYFRFDLFIRHHLGAFALDYRPERRLIFKISFCFVDDRKMICRE